MIDPLEGGQAGGAMDEMGALMAQTEGWLRALERASDEPSGQVSNLIGRFGARSGFFVVQDQAGPVYVKAAQFHVSADGQLLDERGRRVLGFAPNAGAAAKPAALEANARDPAAGRFARFEINDAGVFFGVPPQTAQLKEPGRVELGRLCVALFLAPQELAHGASGDDLIPTRRAGKPRLFPADAANLGGIERQPDPPQFERARENARKMYSASARAEIEVALAEGEDALVRVALNVVK